LARKKSEKSTKSQKNRRNDLTSLNFPNNLIVHADLPRRLSFIQGNDRVSLFSSLFRPSSSSQIRFGNQTLGRRTPRRSSLSRSLISRIKLSVECLEDRTLPSAGVLPGPVVYSPYDFAPASAQFDPIGFGGTYQSGATASGLTRLPPNDPGAVGPYAVTEQSYEFGSAAYVPPQFGLPTSSNKIELTGEVYAPTDLSAGPFPLVVLMHDNHVDEYTTAGGTGYAWPIQPGFQALPNYLGYGYFATTLASHGYIVASISANGVNVLGNSFAGTGMLGRGQLTERTLDIFHDLNADGVVHTRAGDTSAFVDGQMPFGTRFVGKVNMQDVGLMGHSRGGEGVVQGYLVNQAAGSPYGIKAVFAIAPVDFQSPTINNTNFAVLLAYNDGDVSDLQGAHFFDDSRYNVAGDTGAQYTIEVMGADHNFYNTVWSPGGGYPGGSDDGNPGPPTRLTQAQQRGTGLAYMSAFFRTYLGGETEFQPILTGDAPPPPSAQVTPDRIHIGYLPPSDAADRRDINRVFTAANLTSNTLGGAVVTGGLASYTFTTGGPGGSSEPHRNLDRVTIGYTGTLAAFWENDLPATARDERALNDLQFRIGVNYGDARNPPNTAQDFSVELDDGAGNSQKVLVSAYSNDLFDAPTPGGNPHEVLNTVRIPLTAFFGFVDLSNVTTVRFDFDQHNSGAFQVADLAFADPAASAGPSVLSSTPSGDVLGSQSSVRVTFDRPIDTATFTPASVDSFTRTVGSTITELLFAITEVTPVAGSGDQQFDVSFAAQSALGVYQLVIGPNILDLAGNPMDQNHNLIAGEIPDDEYTAVFTIQGLKVFSATPNSNLPGRTDSLRVVFNEAVELSSFNAGALTFTGPDGAHAAVGVAPVSGSSFMEFDVMFEALTAAGSYTVVIGPNIRDVYGNPMDQDGDLVAGEATDVFTTVFSIASPRVLDSTPTGTVEPAVDHVRLTFDREMAVSTFSAEHVSLTGPDGSPIAVTGIAAGGINQLDITFAPQGLAGEYTLVLDGVTDSYGNPLDTYTTRFTLAAFHVLGTNPSGIVPRNTDHLRVTFDRPADPASFGMDQVSLTGPEGAVTVPDVAAVAGSNNTQFDVSFTPLVTLGDYTLTLSTDISDTFGNALAAYTATLTVDPNIVTNGGFETGTFSGWTQAGDTRFTRVLTGTPDGITIHSGAHAAQIGQSGPSFLSQNLTTTVGGSYTLKFWLSHPFSDLGTGTEWLVRVGGNTLMDVHDAGLSVYTQLTFTVTATSSTTTLQFGFVEPSNYFYLDDVSVTANG
jgi:Bacterial Ig-like domain